MITGPRTTRPQPVPFPILRRGAAALLVLLTASLSVRAEWSLLTGDMQELRNIVPNTWTAAQGLSATDQAGKLVSIDTRNIVSLSSGKIPSTVINQGWRLQLRNGDLLIGQPAGVSGQSLMFKLPELDEKIAIPMKQVISLAAYNAPPLPIGAAPSAAEKDIIRMRGEKGATGDTIEGIIVDLDDAKLDLVTGTDISKPNLSLKLANIERVTFGGAAPPRGVPALSARFRFISGSILTVPLDQKSAFIWSLSRLKFNDTAAIEHELEEPERFLQGIDVLGGRVLYLTELEPASEEQISFLDSHWPSQINKNVLGNPLRVGRTTYTRGIGVHTQSTLTYDLDGTFEKLTFRVGLDDSAAPHGEARASIILDGKTLWQSPILKPGEPTPEVSLPISGGKKLELHADPATRLDVLGRVDWLNVALQRK